MRTERIELDLAGTRYTLVASLRAGDRLNRSYGGFRPVVDGLARWDLDVATDVVVAGANVPADQKLEVRQAIFSEGLAALVVPLSRFILVLAGGGRADDESDQEGKPLGDYPGPTSPSASSGSEPDGLDGPRKQ